MPTLPISNDQLRKALAEDGFLHVPNLLPAARIEAVQAQAKEVFVTQMREVGIDPGDTRDEVGFSRALFDLFRRDEKRFIGAGRLCQHLISLHRLSLCEQLVLLVEAAGLSFPTISTRPVMFFNSRHLAKSQGYWKTPPHQDWRSMQGSLNSVVVWVPLLDLDLTLGTLEVVPGSHHDGLLDSMEDDFYRTIDQAKYPDAAFRPIEVKRGDCLIFSAFLVHRSGNNSTDRVRWSCHFRYNDMRERTFIERQFPNPYIYKPQQELITPDFPKPEQLIKLFR